MAKETVLITGIAGFIGFHLAKKLYSLGYSVIGIDNLNPYYDVQLKHNRLIRLGFPEEKINNLMLHESVPAADSNDLIFYPIDLCERDKLGRLFDRHRPRFVIHLAAQAGVRYSLKNPYLYIDSNIVGFINILENCRQHQAGHLVYASSSSVYGANSLMPFSVHQVVDHPISLYAATKKASELMAHTYSHLYGIPTTGLRFFTVYGPWGRPDMALFLFTQKLLAGKPIDVYNQGSMKRDFTYIDDIIEGLARIMERIPAGNPDWDSNHPDPATSRAPYRLFNIGNNHPVELKYFIQVIEKNLGIKAKLNLLPMQPGDVPETYADISDLEKYCGFKPSTPIEEGVRRFVEWYKEYYEIEK